MSAVKIYLGSPGNQLQANAARDMPVLISFAAWQKFRPLTQWAGSFDGILIDSGAYSELNSGIRVDRFAYIDWVATYLELQGTRGIHAWAGLDDISGDWRRSLENYQLGGFPTFHDTDPPELLDDLIEIARNQGGWIGLGLAPPRQGKERWVVDAINRIPDDLHIHGWALGLYSHVKGIDSLDSTHWWREAMKYRTKMPWLTYGETLEIAVKKMKRSSVLQAQDDQEELFTRHPGAKEVRG